MEEEVVGTRIDPHSRRVGTRRAGRAEDTIRADPEHVLPPCQATRPRDMVKGDGLHLPPFLSSIRLPSWLTPRCHRRGACSLPSGEDRGRCFAWAPPGATSFTADRGRAWDSIHSSTMILHSIRFPPFACRRIILTQCGIAPPFSIVRGIGTGTEVPSNAAMRELRVSAASIAGVKPSRPLIERSGWCATSVATSCSRP